MRRALGAGLQRLVDPRRVEREVLADAARVDGDAGVLADEVASRSSATWTFLRIVSSTRWPGTEVSRCRPRPRARRAGPAGCPSAPRRRGARPRPRPPGCRSVAIGAHARPFRGGRAGAPAEDAALEQASCPSSGSARACRRRSRRRRRGPRSVVSPSLVDHEAAVLVVEHGVGEDRLRAAGRSRRHGSGAACTAARSRRRPRGSASCRAAPPGGRRASRRRGPPRPRRRSPARPRRAGRASR